MMQECLKHGQLITGGNSLQGCDSHMNMKAARHLHSSGAAKPGAVIKRTQLKTRMSVRHQEQA